MAQISPLSPGFLVADWIASSRPGFPVFVPVLPDVISPDALSKKLLKIPRKTYLKNSHKNPVNIKPFLCSEKVFFFRVSYQENSLQCFFCVCAHICLPCSSLYLPSLPFCVYSPFLLSSQGSYRKNENHSSFTY